MSLMAKRKTHTQRPAASPPDAPEQYTVRFPPGMRRQLEELARKNFRKMNGEILAALENHLQDNQKTSGDTPLAP